MTLAHSVENLNSHKMSRFLFVKLATFVSLKGGKRKRGEYMHRAGSWYVRAP